MKPDDRSKIQSFMGEISGLKSRQPDEKKFKDWKEKVEKKLDEAFGKGSSESTGFGRIRFFDFNRHGKTKDDPLNEAECREYISRLDEARRYLGRFV
jgi:hypothetical protein